MFVQINASGIKTPTHTGSNKAITEGIRICCRTVKKEDISRKENVATLDENCMVFDHTANKQYRKLDKNIPRKGIARQQYRFPHSCVCARFLYFHHRSAYSAVRNTVCGPIYKSLTDTGMWKLGLRPRNFQERNT